MAKIKNAMTYEAPRAEVILIESQSVLCGSQTQVGTTSMNVGNTNTVLVL